MNVPRSATNSWQFHWKFRKAADDRKIATMRDQFLIKRRVLDLDSSSCIKHATYVNQNSFASSPSPSPPLSRLQFFDEKFTKPRSVSFQRATSFPSTFAIVSNEKYDSLGKRVSFRFATSNVLMSQNSKTIEREDRYREAPNEKASDWWFDGKWTRQVSRWKELLE